MNTKQKSFVGLCILLGLGALRGLPIVSADTIDQGSLEQLSPDMVAAIKRIAPRTHRLSKTDWSTAMELLDGNIGFIDAEGVLNGDLRSVRDLILENAILTGATQQLDVEFVELRPDSDGHRLIYRQLINGIPTRYRSSIVFDESGLVTSLRSHIVDPGFAEAGPQILEDEAISYAIDALVQKSGRDVSDAQVLRSQTDQPGLYYGIYGEPSRPQLFWRMSVGSRSHGLDYSAVVNATTGETSLSPNVED